MPTVSELIAEARSIADLQNSKFVSYADEMRAVNEAYRDLYNRYTESQGEYFVSEVVIQLDATMLDPNAYGQGYLVPLPADFYKLRSVSWNTGGQWYPVQSFSMSQRDFTGVNPMYRLKNNTLWIISAMVVQVKISYYTPPAILTAPDVPLSYFDDLSDFAKLSLRDVSFVDDGQTALYASGNDIKTTSIGRNATATLVTSVTPSKPMYYRGYVYWISAGNIWRMATDLSISLAAAAQIVTDGAVTDLSVFDGLIYYTNATNAKTANLDGSGVAVYGAVGTSFCKLNGFATYLSAGVVLRGLVAVTGIIGTITSIAAVDTSLFVLTSSISGISTIYRYTVAGQVAVDPVIVAVGVSALAQHVIEGPLNYLMTTNNSGATAEAGINFTALSMIADTDLDYPSNEVYEILAYSSAIYYVRKNSDDKKMAIIGARLTELWIRFNDVNQRDEYQPYRINNDYNNSTGFWGRYY
jgi:hypothetical protein